MGLRKKKIGGNPLSQDALEAIRNRTNKIKQRTDQIEYQDKLHDEARADVGFDHKMAKENLEVAKQGTPSEINIQVRNAFTQFVEKAMPYIVLLLFLLCVYWIFSGGGDSSNSNNQSNSVDEMKKNDEILENQFTGFFGGIFLFFYKIWLKIIGFFGLPQPIKKILNSFNQYKNGGPTIPRTTVDSGRCDNIQWIETSGDGQEGSCDSTIRPKDLIWNLNPQFNTEFRTGSEFLEKHSDKAKASLKNLNVVIPWDRSPETTFFVPQCEQAYFANQCRPETKSSSCDSTEQWADGYCCVKANLLKEQGLTCGLTSFNLDQAYDKKNYSKTNKTNPEFNNIVNANQATAPPQNPTGSPTFTNLIGTSASSKMASMTR